MTTWRGVWLPSLHPHRAFSPEVGPTHVLIQPNSSRA